MITRLEELETLHRTPYPGLRPFEGDENDLFFGRERQIGEILTRLGSAQHFVAVVGASGSGKSSLIKAGVIPALLRYELTDAQGSNVGGAWAPITFTPGTNPKDPYKPKIARESPLYRFADALLECLEVAQAEKDDEREWIAETLRTDASGFHAILERSFSKLDNRNYRTEKKTNFLIVIDQFEELFHHTHDDWSEDEALLRQVVAHANKPHPRAYVVLTMRAEHLNDCDRQEGLPDAINKGVYLLGRLDDDEIRSVITAPPRRALFLAWKEAKLKNLENSEKERLPKKIEIHDKVCEQLTKAVAALSDTSNQTDRLPLLQHLLFRIWEAACERTKNESKAFPGEILIDDLENACFPDQDGSKDHKIIGRDIDLGRVVDRWCNKIYQSLSDIDKRHIEYVFRHLALPDDMGKYTQERIDLGEMVSGIEQWEGTLKEKRGNAPTEDYLRELLNRFIQPHAYLTTDAEKVASKKWSKTKVAHESFIRSWQQFKRWIDESAGAFKEFGWLIEQSQRWEELADENKIKELLSVGDYERNVENLEVKRYLNSEIEWRRVRKFLDRRKNRVSPDNQEDLAKECERIKGLLNASYEKFKEDEKERIKAATERIKAEAERVLLKKKSSHLKVAGTIAALFIISTALAVYSYFQSEVERTHRGLKSRYFETFAIATTTAGNFDSLTQESPEDSLVPLKQELIAAHHLLDTIKLRQQEGGSGERADELQRADALSELHVSSRLWQVLTQSAWISRSMVASNDITSKKCSGSMIFDQPEDGFKPASRSNNDEERNDCFFYVKGHDKTGLSLPPATEYRFDKTLRHLVVLTPSLESSKKGNLIIYEASRNGYFTKMAGASFVDQAVFTSDFTSAKFAPESGGVKYGNGNKNELLLIPEKVRLLGNGDGQWVSIDEATRTAKKIYLQEKSRPMKNGEIIGGCTDSNYCIEVEKNDYHSQARLYKKLSFSNKTEAEYTVLSTPLGDEVEISADKPWYLSEDNNHNSKGNGFQPGDKLQSHPRPGWLYVPAKGEGTKSGYIGYPWSLQARTDVALVVYKEYGGCGPLAEDLSKRPSLKARYRRDYEFIINAEELKKLEDALCDDRSDGASK